MIIDIPINTNGIKIVKDETKFSKFRRNAKRKTEKFATIIESRMVFPELLVARNMINPMEINMKLKKFPSTETI